MQPMDDALNKSTGRDVEDAHNDQSFWSSSCHYLSRFELEFLLFWVGVELVNVGTNKNNAKSSSN